MGFNSAFKGLNAYRGVEVSTIRSSALFWPLTPPPPKDPPPGADLLLQLKLLFAPPVAADGMIILKCMVLEMGR